MSDVNDMSFRIRRIRTMGLEQYQVLRGGTIIGYHWSISGAKSQLLRLLQSSHRALS